MPLYCSYVSVLFDFFRSCRILDCLNELRDEVSEVLEGIDNQRGVVEEHLTVLDLMPHKTAQHMCYEELKQVRVITLTIASKINDTPTVFTCPFQRYTLF